MKTALSTAAPTAHLADLLVLLVRNRRDASCRLWQPQLLRWLGAVLETGYRAKGSTNALVSAAVPTAAVRAKRVDPLLKKEIARAAGSMELVMSAAKVIKGLHCFHKLSALREKSGAAFVEEGVGRYYHAVKDFFQNPAPTRMCLAMDATRIDGKDTLYAALHDPSRALACWVPPQVPRVWLGPPAREGAHGQTATLCVCAFRRASPQHAAHQNGFAAFCRASPRSAAQRCVSPRNAAHQTPALSKAVSKVPVLCLCACRRV